LNFFENIKIRILRRENIFFLIFTILIFFLDRFSKNIILNDYTENQVYINEYVNFNLIWNTGIGFGILSTDSILVYNSITIIIGLVILYLFYIQLISDQIDRTIFCMIIGGALGNFYDRLVLQAVPDFIDLHYKEFHWFTFNVADIFISFGIIAFITRSFFVKN
tara:strand:+ start:1718 stop:2209 length:492 start_codon:yes stop_codon:yes gene_type:complete